LKLLFFQLYAETGIEETAAKIVIFTDKFLQQFKISYSSLPLIRLINQYPYFTWLAT
jgi:hypothetical protein